MNRGSGVEVKQSADRSYLNLQLVQASASRLFDGL